jgi:hypothetical protein
MNSRIGLRSVANSRQRMVQLFLFESLICSVSFLSEAMMAMVNPHTLTYDDNDCACEEGRAPNTKNTQVTKVTTPVSIPTIMEVPTTNGDDNTIVIMTAVRMAMVMAMTVSCCTGRNELTSRFNLCDHCHSHTSNNQRS